MSSLSSQSKQPDLNQIISELRPKLKALVDRHLSNGLRVRVDASDIVQDAFQKAIMRGDLHNENSIPLAALLFKLAKQSTVDNFRKHLRAKQRTIANEIRLPEVDGKEHAACRDFLNDPSTLASSLEARTQLFDALGSLNKINQEILVLRFFDEKSVKEIAAELDMTPESISKRIMRALKKLALKLHHSDLNVHESVEQA